MEKTTPEHARAQVRRKPRRKVGLAGPRGKYDGNVAVPWTWCHWQPGKTPAEAIRQADLVEQLAAIIREYGVQPQ